MDIGEAATAGDGGATPVNQEEEVNALGKGGQRRNRCGGLGHWAKECPAAPGKGVDGLKGQPGGKGGKGDPKGYKPKGGWQTKGRNKLVEGDQCGKIAHVEKGLLGVKWQRMYEAG